MLKTSHNMHNITAKSNKQFHSSWRAVSCIFKSNPRFIPLLCCKIFCWCLMLQILLHIFLKPQKKGRQILHQQLLCWKLLKSSCTVLSDHVLIRWCLRSNKLKHGKHTDDHSFYLNISYIMTNIIITYWLINVDHLSAKTMQNISFKQVAPVRTPRILWMSMWFPVFHPTRKHCSSRAGRASRPDSSSLLGTVG